MATGASKGWSDILTQVSFPGAESTVQQCARAEKDSSEKSENVLTYHLLTVIMVMGKKRLYTKRVGPFP